MTVRVPIPVRRSGREVSVHNQRCGTDATQVVDDRRHRVIRHIGKPVATGLRDDTCDHGLRPEAFEHEGERGVADPEDERRLAPGGVVSMPSLRLKELRCRQRRRQRSAFPGIEGLVVDARRSVGRDARLPALIGRARRPVWRPARRRPGPGRPVAVGAAAEHRTRRGGIASKRVRDRQHRLRHNIASGAGSRERAVAPCAARPEPMSGGTSSSLRTSGDRPRTVEAPARGGGLGMEAKPEHVIDGLRSLVIEGWNVDKIRVLRRRHRRAHGVADDPLAGER